MSFRGGLAPGTPTGAAGGDLTGNYPNPTIANVSILTNKGDMLIENPAGTAVRLGIGSPQGQVLGVASTGLPAYQNPGGEQNFSGQTAPNLINGVTTIALVASRAFAVRFTATKTRTITQIAFALTVAAGSNDACDVGIFNSAMTTLLGSAGATTGKLNGTAGQQVLPLTGSVPLVAGTTYYAAFSSGTQGTTAASVAMTSLVPAACLLMGTTAGNLLQAFQNTAHPLAAPFTPGVGGIAQCPILGLLE